MTDRYHSVPQPEDIPVREREDAMGAYFMMFASAAIGLPLPVFNLIAAIIYYYINRSKSRFVSFHTLQSLLSQIPVTIINIGGVIWILRVIIHDLPFIDELKGYIAMIIIANLIYFAFSIVGAVRARKGRFYYFWFFGKWAFHQVYRIRKVEPEEEILNKPPKM